jgi:hypothetical protein
VLSPAGTSPVLQHRSSAQQMRDMSANLAERTARKPKASPQVSNAWSVVTLTRRESAAGRPLSPQAEAAAWVSGLKGMRTGNVSTFAMTTGYSKSRPVSVGN